MFLGCMVLVSKQECSGLHPVNPSTSQQVSDTERKCGDVHIVGVILSPTCFPFVSRSSTYRYLTTRGAPVKLKDGRTCIPWSCDTPRTDTIFKEMVMFQPDSTRQPNANFPLVHQRALIPSVGYSIPSQRVLTAQHANLPSKTLL